MEKEREQTSASESTAVEEHEYIEVNVTVHQKNIGTVRVKKGTRQQILEQVLEALKKHDVHLHMNNLAAMTILLNNQKVTVRTDGTVEEGQNIAITEHSVLVMTKRVLGGTPAAFLISPFTS